MILFIISFFLVVGSSYLMTSLITPKKSIIGAIYLPIIAFAQIVLTFEFLSLFTAIKQFWVLGLNFLIFITSCYVWMKKGKVLWSLDCSDFKNRINNSFKLDKSLMLLYVGFCVFIISALILCVLLPVTSADAQGYHVARSIFWVFQGNLNHFEVADIRALCLPINSEILYAWVILLVKKDVFLGFFAFVGYVVSIISLYNILGYLKFCVRRRLWVIFILSSFACVLVQASGTETDIIIAALVSSSMFLFWYALKKNKISALYMSSLSYALAIGTKTTALIAVPAVGLFLLALCIIHKKYKPLFWFLGFGLINFLIFSSYNYILNFIHFSNFMGSDNFMVVSKNYYGFKGMIANFIKYIFMFLDFTGFTWSRYIGIAIMHLRSSVLSFVHLGYINDGIYTVGGVNNFLLEPMMGAGILGFLLFLPCLVWSLIKPIFCWKSKKIWSIFGFSVLFIINILVISYLLAYMAFSVRFIMFFMVISSPILAYSYFSKFNPLKYIIIFFALFYLVLVSTHLWPRPLCYIAKLLKMNPSISALRDRALCKDYSRQGRYSNSACALKLKIKKFYSKENKILIFMPSADNIYTIKLMEYEGYNIDFGRLENIKNIDLDSYNIIITTKNGQASTVVTDYEKRKNEIEIVNDDYIQHKKDLVPCVYKPNDKIPALYNGKQVPAYQVLCIMSQDYIDNHHLKLIGVAGVLKPNMGEMNYYQIFSNEKRPIIMKKIIKN